jgi:hypothetical protein
MRASPHEVKPTTDGKKVAGFPKKSNSTCRVIAQPAQKSQSRILRQCQNTAQRFNAPVLDALLARILARGAFGLDVSIEMKLARQLAALSERREGATI